MNRIALITTALMMSLSLYAQNDTTKIDVGKKKILIIEDKSKIERNINDLNKGKQDFQQNIETTNQKIKVLNDSITQLNEQLNKSEADAQKKLLQSKIEATRKQIEEHQKELEAFQKGIEDVDTELDDMKQELADSKEDKKSRKHDRDINLDFGDKFEKITRRHRFDGHWAGFELGLNNFVNSNRELALPADGEFMELNSSKSWAYTLNLLEYSIPIWSNRIGFVTGMGFEWNNYRLKKNVDLVEDPQGVIIGVPVDPNLKPYSKNTLNTVYLTAPLILEFQIPSGNKHLHIGGGVVGGIKIGSKTKKYYEENGDERKQKNKDDYQLSPYRYEWTLRVGYRSLNLFANYSAVSLFKKDKGPELYPFTIGLVLLDF